MTAQLAFTKDHDKAIRAFAARVVRRARSAGAATVSIEDVYQELCIAWCKARDAWDEKFGVPFLAYLNFGMRNHINRWVQGQIFNGRCVSLDSTGILDGEPVGLHSLIPDDSALAGIEEFEALDYRDFVVARLSPRARTFIDLLSEPPKFLRDAVKQARERANSGKERDVVSMAPTRVTAAMVLDFMNLTNRERVILYKELHKMGETASRMKGT